MLKYFYSLKPSLERREECLALLMQNGADLELRNKKGKCANDYAEVVELPHKRPGLFCMLNNRNNIVNHLS